MLGRPLPAAVGTRPLGLAGLLAALTASLAAPAPAEARRTASLDGQEARIVGLVNGIRTSHGLRRVRVSHRLNHAANRHSWSMLVADFFSHDSNDGTASATRIRRHRDARRVGEVLAYLPRSQRRGGAWRVVNLWMQSPGHRTVLMTPGFRRIGVARQSGRLNGNRAIVFTADLTSKH